MTKMMEVEHVIAHGHYSLHSEMLGKLYDRVTIHGTFHISVGEKVERYILPMGGGEYLPLYTVFTSRKYAVMTVDEIHKEMTSIFTDDEYEAWSTSVTEIYRDKACEEAEVRYLNGEENL